MAPGLNASEKLLRKYSRSAEEIEAIKDEGKLKELAGVTEPDKTIVVADEKIDAATGKKIDDMDLPAVTKTLAGLGVDVKGMDEQRQRQELRENKKFKADSEKEYLDQIQAQDGNSDKTVISHSTLVQRAIARGVGQAKEGEEDKYAAATRINTGLLRGANDENRRRAINEIGDLFADQLSGNNFEEIKKAVLSSDPDKEQQLASALGFKDADALSAAASDPENAKSEIFQILQALQKSREFDLEGRGVQASDPAAKQKTERMTVESPKVELHADNVELAGFKDVPLGDSKKKAPAEAAEQQKTESLAKTTAPEQKTVKPAEESIAVTMAPARRTVISPPAAADTKAPMPAAIAARLEQNKPATAQTPSVGSTSPVQLAGRIKLDGLTEVIAELTAPQLVDTPSGGPAIIKDQPRQAVS